jgi:hypothetical protein
MDGLELYLLGRRLMRIGGAAVAGPGAERLPTAMALVLTDVLLHPDSSISEITERTGFPQSYVSTSVARLRDRGVVETGADPADGRRTLVRVTHALTDRVASRVTVPVDDAVIDAMDTDDDKVAADVMAALELLAAHLVPRQDAERAGSGRRG